MQLDASTVISDEIAAAISTPGAYVLLTVPDGTDRHFDLPHPAEGVTLAIEWPWLRIAAVPRIAFEQCAAPDPAPSMRTLTFRLDADTSVLSLLSGTISCERVTVTAASLRTHGSTVSARALSIESATARQVLLGSTVVSVRRGQFDGRLDGDTLVIAGASRAQVAGEAGAPDEHGSPGGAYVSPPPLVRADVIVTGQVMRCELIGVTLDARPGSLLEDCTGSIRLVSCREATIVGSRRDPLFVAADFPISIDERPRPLEGAVLLDVAIAPASMAAVVAESEMARVFDPAPETLERSLRSFDASRRTSIAELLHDRLGQKALRQQTVDTAAIALLDMRRSSARRSSGEWLLLNGYRLLGYGRRIARPLTLWLVIVSFTLGFRVNDALREESGLLSVHGGHVQIASAGPALKAAGNDALTIALLPVTWSHGAEQGVEQRVGIHGGYLSLLRLLMIVPLLAAAGGVRRRVRVRPHSEGR